MDVNLIIFNVFVNSDDYVLFLELINFIDMLCIYLFCCVKVCSKIIEVNNDVGCLF